MSDVRRPSRLTFPTLSKEDLARLRDQALRQIEAALAERWEGLPITPSDRGRIEADAQALCRAVLARDPRLTAAFSGQVPRLRLEWNEDGSGVQLGWVVRG